MTKILKNIKGDKVIWAVAALLALFSFLPVYSASSNLAYLSYPSNQHHIMKLAVFSFTQTLDKII